MTKTRTYERSANLSDFMTLEEEYNYYNEVLERVIRNPRFYLDNLDELDVFFVSFINYHRKRPKNQNLYK